MVIIIYFQQNSCNIECARHEERVLSTGLGRYTDAQLDRQPHISLDSWIDRNRSKLLARHIAVGGMTAKH